MKWCRRRTKRGRRASGNESEKFVSLSFKTFASEVRAPIERMNVGELVKWSAGWIVIAIVVRWLASEPTNESIKL